MTALLVLPWLAVTATTLTIATIHAVLLAAVAR